MRIRYGFTGTQRGMTAAQLAILQYILPEQCKLRHGDCIGADAQAHEIAQTKGGMVCIHPPINDTKRAFCQGADKTLLAKEYLDRNKDIVDGSEIVVAAPGEKLEQLRSGTWSTIRYARSRKKPLIVIYPDGTVGS